MSSDYDPQTSRDLSRFSMSDFAAKNVRETVAAAVFSTEFRLCFMDDPWTAGGSPQIAASQQSGGKLEVVGAT